VSGTTDYSGFARAQLVVEAVFEDLAIKRQVIAELERVLEPDAVIASNTSSLPVGSLGAEAQHPERIVGMHFFSPVHKMPLLEVVRAQSTAEQAVATVVQTGREMGKTVIVVADGPGFYTTRVLAFMVQEAGRVFEQGGSIESVDRAMTAFGFPVGPLALTDEVGLDVAAHVSDVLGQAFGERFTASASIGRMVQAGRLGRKSKAGFYDYSGRKKKPDPAVYAFRAAAPQRLPADLIQRRLVLSFVNEAARCLEEGILACPRDGDIGAILGIGFPPFLGGPFRYADRLGAESIVAQLRQMQFAYGSGFAPATILERMAENGGRFYEP
jgi:3-hydroxyacyl-CoA dehydrogenase/enoyl-CoA hydratase/3-hydroxybutyryl-CoA epimerase